MTNRSLLKSVRDEYVKGLVECATHRYDPNGNLIALSFDEPLQYYEINILERWCSERFIKFEIKEIT